MGIFELNGVHLESSGTGGARPLTVLFNTYPIAFDCPGGGEVQLDRCAAALRRRGVQVLLYDQWHPQFAEVDLVHYFSVQGWTEPFFDCVRRHGLPLVVSPIIWLGEKKYDYDLNAIGLAVSRCDRALPNSRAEGRLLAAYYGLPEERFVPIVNGVDDVFLEPGDPKLFRSHFDIEGDFLLSIANIEPRKNQRFLLKASRDCGMQLVLAGRIRDREYWRECEEAMHSGVRYVGSLEFASDLHRSAYAACRAFVLPTLLETPGLAALEAAAQGAPVCVTREGCTEEYFADHAVYVDPESVDSIRAGLLAVMNHERSDALRDHIRTRYTWDEAARQLEVVYRTLAK